MLEVGIHAHLIAYVGLGTVAWIDNGFRRQLRYDRGKAFEQLLPGTAGEVGTPYTHTEECVARKGYMLFFAIKNDAAWGMARGVEHLQLMIAKGNDVTVAQDGAYRSAGKVCSNAEAHHAALLVEVFYHRLVGGVGLGLQRKGREDEGGTKHMVEMAVGAEVVNGLQMVVADIGLDSLLLGIVKGTAVYDDALVGLVAHHVAILLKRIHLESLDLHALFFYLFTFLPFLNWYIDAVFLLEPFLAEIAGEFGGLNNLLERLRLALQVAALQTDYAIGDGVVLLLADVLAHNLNQVG